MRVIEQRTDPAESLTVELAPDNDPAVVGERMEAPAGGSKVDDARMNVELDGVIDSAGEPVLAAVFTALERQPGVARVATARLAPGQLTAQYCTRAAESSPQPHRPAQLTPTQTPEGTSAPCTHS